MTWAPQFSELAMTCTDGVQQLRALLALLGLAYRRRWGSRNLVGRDAGWFPVRPLTWADSKEERLLLTRQPMKYYIWNLSCMSLHSFKLCPLSTVGMRPISPSSLPSQSCSLLLGNPVYSRTHIPGDGGDVW